MSNANLAAATALRTVEEIDALGLSQTDRTAALNAAIAAWDVRSGEAYDDGFDREADRCVYEMEKCRKALPAATPEAEEDDRDDTPPLVGEDRDGLIWSGSAWVDAYDWYAERNA